MWNEYLTMVVMAALLRLSYEMSRPGSTIPQTSTNPNGGPLTSQQKEWAEKAVRRYAETQEKKWHRWSEAMFEAKQS
jgi:hypothetical protein